MEKGNKKKRKRKLKPLKKQPILLKMPSDLCENRDN
jgi:hypothetical protein